MKKIAIFVVIIFSFLLYNNQYVYGNVQKKILVIGSYSNNNSWENSVIKGIKEYTNDNYILKIEYLDSKSTIDPNYRDTFLNLLNIKYKNEDIRTIITIDDEAFELVKNNLFNKDTFLYKIPVVYVGVNSDFTLSKEEEALMTGIIEKQKNISFLDIILNIHKDLKNLYVLSDKSIYSQYNSKDIEEIKFDDLNIKIIQSSIFNEIEKKIRNIAPKHSAIYIYGTFKDGNNDDLSELEVINRIKQISNIPIYTKLESYVIAGAIGGVVNDGEKIGELAGRLLDRVVENDSETIIMPAFETINKILFNFKEVRAYNINPLKLPNNTEYINKSPLNMLIPKWAEIVIWFIIVGFFTSVIFLFYQLYLSKKKAKENTRLLIESEERNKLKTDFLITISHELRTPLNIIINKVKFLLLKIDENDYTTSYLKSSLEIIDKNSNRLLRYVNNLIYISKLELGLFNVRLNNENIVEVVEEVTLSIVEIARSFNQEVIFDTEEEEIIIGLDKEKIEQVMLNLLSNAIKFSKNEGKITVSVAKEKNNVVIKVSDEGIGIKEELQSKIFEKFKRVESVSDLSVSTEGSGLGLYIVKNIIEEHQGKISLVSEEGKGSTFIITLPNKKVIGENSKNINVSSLENLIKQELSEL